MSGPMTRCECHEVPFSTVARYAADHPGENFKQVMRNTGCGQTCTACHCDLKAYLQAARKPARVTVIAQPTTAASAAA